MAVEKAKNVPPFVLWCSATIPTAFDDSMSYYEALCALYKWVQDNIINVVNNNADILKEYVKMVDDLKAYVDNYFENLDVQEEINNKLDEMAEGGQLAGIIAQFLEMSPVFAYGTIAEMAAADNLNDGCIARVLGNTAAADGDGAYYKVRTKGEGETGDGVQKVEIGDSLIADRIIDVARTEIEEYADDNYINVKFNGAKGDGTTDDTAILQTLIDNNPHKTLFFPAGTYLISEPLEIHTGNAHQVNLKLDHNAKITTNESITFLLIVGDEEATGDNAYDRYAEGSIVVIDGGIFDCGAASGAIKLTANQKQTKVKNAVVYGVNDYGIYVARGTNTSVSSDADLANLSVNGKGSEVGGTGIYLYGYDNKLSHIRVNACQIGVEDAGGSFMEDVHALYSYTSQNVTVAQYETTKGFVLSGGGVCMLQQCYADTFANGFVIEGAGTAKVYMTDCMTYWYTAVGSSKVNAIKVARNDQPYYLSIDGFELNCPNSSYNVDFDALWLNGKQEYIAVYDFIHINHLHLSNVSTYEQGGVLKKNDWITCQAFYDKDSVQIKDAWATTMTQNSWYPVAYLRGGVNQFTLRMANDQIIRVTAGIGSTCTISATNLYNGSHSGEMQVAICNAAQETDRGNVWGAFLCVRATSNNVGYNPALYDGLNNWNTQIFTRRNFMATIPLNNPTVNASANFNA